MSMPNRTAARRRGRDLTKESSWRDRLALYVRSGLTVRAFCEREAIRETAFYFWRREIHRRDATGRAGFAPPASFVELRAGPAAAIAPAIELVLPRDRRLLIRGGFDAGLLREVLCVLEDRPC
jgi:hypothetical protein